MTATWNSDLDFQVGDVVTLASGSPPMTVERLANREATCVWVYESQVHRHVFANIVLRRVVQK